MGAGALSWCEIVSFPPLRSLTVCAVLLFSTSPSCLLVQCPQEPQLSAQGASRVFAPAIRASPAQCRQAKMALRVGRLPKWMQIATFPGLATVSISSLQARPVQAWAGPCCPPSRGNRWRRGGPRPMAMMPPSILQNHAPPRMDPAPTARQRPPFGNATMIGSIGENEGLARPVATITIADEIGRRAKRASLLRDKSDGTAGPAILDATPVSSCSAASRSLSHTLTPVVIAPTNALRQPGIGHDGHPLRQCYEMLVWCNGWWRPATGNGERPDRDWRNGSSLGLEIKTWDARTQYTRPIERI
ncbi:hypothetical protein QBC39DRAFT_144181 [Podospora conica]|nr:hypothetical protein QBC39DRAFT_144181 [Schizothecium conicum]